VNYSVACGKALASNVGLTASLEHFPTRRALLPLEVNAHNHVGCDPVAALLADRVEARAHGFQIDFLARDHTATLAQLAGEYKAKALVCAAWTRAGRE
jgi:hypothetical protein